MSEPVEVRHAATVVVVRGTGADAEVLLLRRGDTAGFMAGMFVYPGGRLDPADLDAAAGDLDAAARWTALRECFEESGLLLATDQQGQPATPAHAEALRASDAPFAEALQALSLRPGLNDLRAFARWVTPAVERRRFDTRFYLAHHPHGQAAAPDGFEMVEHRWRRPVDALQEYATSDMLLSPPPSTSSPTSQRSSRLAFRSTTGPTRNRAMPSCRGSNSPAHPASCCPATQTTLASSPSPDPPA